MTLVDRAKLRENLEAVADRLAREPDAGVVRPWVSARLDRDVLGTSEFEQYGHSFVFRSDESAGRGGSDQAPSPMRYLLSSVAFCMQGWTAKVSAARDVTLDGLRVDVRTLLDMRGEHLVDGAPAHPQWMVVDVRVDSPCGEAAMIDLLREALRRCPVTSLMSRAIPLHLMVRHNGTVTLDDRPDDLRDEHTQLTSK